MSRDIAIIGAGPAGLMAAEVLAEAGCTVTIYDRMPSPARKFLIAGRGGLNLTHSEPLERFLTRYGDAQEWLTPAVTAFTPDDLRRWCELLGEETFVGSSGRVFPKKMKAVQLLRAWLAKLERLGVRYQPKHTWQGWDAEGNLRFTHATGETLTVRADATLLALGGASWPRLGSDGGWVGILKSSGVEVNPLVASNCGFAVPWTEVFRSRFAGEPLKPVAVTHQGNTRQGEAMLTEHGIEGGAVYALSAAIRDAVAQEGETTLFLDLRPAMTQDALAKKLHAPRGSKSLSAYLRGQGFGAAAIGLLREAWTAEELAKADATQLASWLKAVPLRVTGVAGIARAISSGGGIRRAAVTDDFMLKTLPGVFAAGEMLDWEAPTGGYLLQGCYSTAVAAARGIIAYCTRTQ